MRIPQEISARKGTVKVLRPHVAISTVNGRNLLPNLVVRLNKFV